MKEGWDEPEAPIVQRGLMETDGAGFQGQPRSAIHIFESGCIRPIRPIGQHECPNLGSGNGGQRRERGSQALGHKTKFTRMQQ